MLHFGATGRCILPKVCLDESLKHGWFWMFSVMMPPFRRFSAAFDFWLEPLFIVYI
jgi:hypothetical protein